MKAKTYALMISQSVLIMTLFCYCSSENVQEISQHIKNASPIEGKIISKSEELYVSPQLMVFFDPYLILYSPREEWLISVFDVDRKTIVNRFAKFGRGPQEFQMLYSIYVSSDKAKVYFWDAGKKELFSVLCSELTSSDVTLTSEARFQERFLHLFKLDENDCYLASGLISEGRFVTYCNGEKTDIYRIFPKFSVLQADQLNQADTVHLNMACINVPSIQPDGKLFANIIRSSEILEVYKAEDGRIQQIWANEWGIEPQTLESLGGGATVVNQNWNAHGFEEISVSNTHIFCTYNEIPYGERESGFVLHGNYIFKTNWDGEIESVFSLTHPLRVISVSTDGKRFFGIATIDNDYRIMEFAF
ncbi:MAG: BF3164 family lipoprotein [Bacteroidales bacterium]|jgi:hypothetical protein|nr:BF3164 family lipoprotein [Bacteroidales bacterium]